MDDGAGNNGTSARMCVRGVHVRKGGVCGECGQRKQLSVSVEAKQSKAGQCSAAAARLRPDRVRSARPDRPPVRLELAIAGGGTDEGAEKREVRICNWTWGPNMHSRTGISTHRRCKGPS